MGCHFSLTHAVAIQLLCLLHHKGVTQHPAQPIKVLSLVAEWLIEEESTQAKVLDALAAQGSLQHLRLLSVLDYNVKPFSSPLPPCRPFLSSPCWACL